ncbi:MAG TPA: M3 family metallopeptidase [Candidatus Eremiobacteraceae bacterium]|nr:M3 family metallopeptidase [Candidatus Eremiobacteraceae bacterium]
MKRPLTLLASTAAAVAVLFSAGGAAALTPALPAQTGLNWHETPAQLTATCDSAIALAKQRVDAIASVPGNANDFKTSIAALENVLADLTDQTTAQTTLNQLSPDKAIRDASTDCNQKASNYQVEVSADPRIYAEAQKVTANGTAKTIADRKLVEYYLINGRRSGAGLDDQKRKQVTQLFQHLNDLERDFALALSNDATTIAISKSEALSLPSNFVATLQKTPSGYTVPVNESTYDQFMVNERSSAARKRFSVAYGNRGGQKNVQRLQDAVAVRDQLAHLLGFSDWAAYQLDAKMAKTPQRVETFLTQIDSTLLPKAKSEIASLTALKHSQGDPGPLERWDYGYYENLLVKTRYQVNGQEVRQYFPIDHVISSVFAIYQKLLGVQFAEITPADAWAPGVREYSIADTATGKPIGWFYLDLFPRPGKYDHFANFPIRAGRVMPDGTYQKPVTSIIGNWPVGAPGKPALLSHEDVITFFHEFGHAMHSSLCIAPYETLYGTSVRPDFVEAPSQMLENFMWQPAILKEVSSNVETGQPLPDALIAKMLALKHVSDGMTWTTQAFYAQYDMTIHSSGPDVNVDTAWSRLQPQMTPFTSVPGTHPEAGFGHLMGGYDAGYYGYLWSKVYAQDMFTVFQQGGLENPEVGMRYRKDILEPGATEEPDVLVERFIGRPLSYDAFYRDIGIRK